MKDWLTVLMIVMLYTSIGVGYTINGIEGAMVGIFVTLAIGFILGIGFLGLIIRN
jgi:hypothetical protein